MDNFVKISSCKVNDVIPVHKFRSTKSGLHVIVAEVEGPLVNGYFVLPTEAHDDDGLPHTLEHLIFLGSEDYPYKGVLDLIANRCLASGTNAWTDTDHTCYTMTTAGCDGFLSLLPVYMDHILFPTLTEYGFVTEVHHISGLGEDGGVVYCEMQGRENTGESRAHLELLRALYPNSGYSSETGGIMKNLRTSTTNKKVKDYHKAFYRPDNLHIIITGQIEASAIFKALDKLEKKIVTKLSELPPFERPWQKPVSPLNESKDIKILYAADEEDCGMVYVGFLGPKATIEHDTLTACSVLLRYLSDTSVSPLQREFVENVDPYASNVGYNIGENAVSSLYFTFENVPIEKIDKIPSKLKAILQNIANGQEQFDMDRMRNLIEKYMLETLSSLETNPHDSVAFHLIGDILYGQNDSDFESRLNSNKVLKGLLDKSAEFWTNLTKKYLDTDNVVVRSFPSIQEQNDSAKIEIDRIEKQRKELKESGLKEKEEILLKAMEHNEICPPKEMLTSCPIPSTDGIKFHPVNITKSTQDTQSFPAYTELYDLHSNFLYIIVSMNTEKLPEHLRPYMLLFLELLTVSPVHHKGKLMPYEEVVNELEKDLVSYETSLGIDTKSRFSLGPYSSVAVLEFQVEQKKYDIGVEWIRDLLLATEFNAERVQVIATKMNNDISQAKREGNSIARDILKAMYFKEMSNVRLSSLIKQQKFLLAIIEKLNDKDKAQQVIDDLYALRKALVSIENIGIHIATNVKQANALGLKLDVPWKDFLASESNEEHKLNVLQDWQLMDMNSLLKDHKGCVIGMGCVESAYLFQSHEAIKDFNDPDLPALLLFIQYLSQLEGPLWKQIRGQGFAYGYNIIPRPNEGLLYFTLYRATNVVGAWKKTRAIIEEQLKDNVWDSTLLESARSSIIFEIIAREKTIGALVIQAFLSSFKKVDAGYNQRLVQQIGHVTEADLKMVGEKYVKSLFSPQSRIAIVSHTDKAKEVAEAFDKMGYPLKVETNLEDGILAH